MTRIERVQHCRTTATTSELRELTTSVAICGVVALVVVGATNPLDLRVGTLSWVFMIGGLLLALLPDPVRRVGRGLLYAGLVVPACVLVAVSAVYTLYFIYGR